MASPREEDSSLRFTKSPEVTSGYGDEMETASTREQHEVEESVRKAAQAYVQKHSNSTNRLSISRPVHAAFLLKGLYNLSTSYENSLDASHPWLCYWITNSLDLLDVQISAETKHDICDYLSRCQHPRGGFGGAPGFYPHLAATYAAVNALCIVGTEEAYGVINRHTLKEFMTSMVNKDGSLKIEGSGESDIRAAYCAISVASLANINLDIFDGTAEWIVRCQTYEGGFAGCPGMEAHGGYTYCGLAALALLNRLNLCDMQSLLRWLVNRQMAFEGGFQGRTNKLVDGCYSFWQGASFPVIHMALAQRGDGVLRHDGWLFDETALQEYVLLASQSLHGGFIDKPGKSRDYYHTCYCLAGLAVAQYFTAGKSACPHIVGIEDNDLKPIHPLHGIIVEAHSRAVDHFYALNTV